MEHGDYTLYGLDKKWVERAEHRYRLQQRRELQRKLDVLYESKEFYRQSYNKDHNELTYLFMKDTDKEIEKLERRIYFLSQLKSKQKSFDLERIKQIPIGDIIDFTPQGFAIKNPLRQERSPSNSFYWNKKKNYWVDYGTGEWGSIIDLVMKMNKCSFVDACKKLDR